MGRAWVIFQFAYPRQVPMFNHQYRQHEETKCTISSPMPRKETSEQNAPLTADDASPDDVLTPRESTGWQPSPPPTHHEAHDVVPSPLPAEEELRTAPTRRQALLYDDFPNAEKHHQHEIEVAPSSGRSTNLRRSHHLLKFLLLVYLANLLVIAAFGTWFYNFINREVETRLADFRPEAKAPSTPDPAPTPVAAPVKVTGVSAEELGKVTVAFNSQLTELQAQLQASQKRLAEVEQQNQLHATRLKDLAQESPQVPLQPAPTVSVTDSTIALESNLSPSQAELVLLKERNRLTGYADEAISTGAREPYENLWAALDDPRRAKLIHAARTEILRVQNYYLSGSRIERYDIPVGDYYPDSASLRDAQLPEDKLIELMSNPKHPWQVRLKAANLLGLRRSTAVGDALVKVIKQDANLDVVKEATFSFEQMTGFRAKLFEPASVEAWWKQYNEAPPPPDKVVKKPAPETKP
jgi:hypothetical protein